MHLQKAEKSNDNAEELEAFAARKVTELDEYDETLEKRKEDKALVDGGKMTKEEFIANALNVSPSSTSALEKTDLPINIAHGTTTSSPPVVTRVCNRSFGNGPFPST
jgi:hypothetical protein